MVDLKLKRIGVLKTALLLSIWSFFIGIISSLVSFIIVSSLRNSVGGIGVLGISSMFLILMPFIFAIVSFILGLIFAPIVNLILKIIKGLDFVVEEIEEIK